MSEQVDLGGDDPSLLGDIARGDREAFQRLYWRYAGRLLGYARRVLGNRALAEDVVQEVFTVIWLKASTYRPELGTPGAWIYMIARRKLVDHWRRQPPVGEAARHVPEQGIQPSPEVALLLECALARLSPEQRQAVEVTCLGGFTHEEAATALDVPLGTLKSRIRQALGRMRSLLAKDEKI
jgi:RNA polymerase sigma-70 factor (ECF subfamily)